MPWHIEQCWDATSRERHSSCDTEQSYAGIFFLWYNANWYMLKGMHMPVSSLNVDWLWRSDCGSFITLCFKLLSGKSSSMIFQNLLQFLEGKNENLKLVTKKDLESGNLDGFHAECLTDTWIGNQRWSPPPTLFSLFSPSRSWFLIVGSRFIPGGRSSTCLLDLFLGDLRLVEKECVQNKACQMWRKQLVQLQVIVGQRKWIIINHTDCIQISRRSLCFLFTIPSISFRIIGRPLSPWDYIFNVYVPFLHIFELCAPFVCF